MPWYRIDLEISGRFTRPQQVIREQSLKNDAAATRWFNSLKAAGQREDNSNFYDRPLKLLRIDVQEVTTEITPGEWVDEEKG